MDAVYLMVLTGIPFNNSAGWRRVIPDSVTRTISDLISHEWSQANLLGAGYAITAPCCEWVNANLFLY